MATLTDNELGELAMKFRKVANDEAGALFLKLRRWQELNPGVELEEKFVVHIAKNLAIDILKKETKFDRRTGKIRRKEVSLDEVTQNADGTGERLVGYPKELTKDDGADERDHADFERLLKRLKPRLRKAIQLRRDGYSFAEIGEHFKVTMERARQMVSEAILKMRTKL